MMNTQNSTASALSNGTLNHLLSMIGLGAANEVPVDGTTLSAWLQEGREMRVQASSLAEKPPLLSY